MTFEPLTNDQVFFWLRQLLEPDFQVVAEPLATYYSEHKFCYRVLQGDTLLLELAGDFRQLPPGELVVQARAFVDQLLVGNRLPLQLARRTTICRGSNTEGSPIASRLPPRQTYFTYFSSGRAAFAWLLQEVVRPRRVWLPTFVCWSLISTLQQKFPSLPLLFYTVDRQLKPTLAEAGGRKIQPLPEPGDALVYIHYFGHRNSAPGIPSGCTLLEDVSHTLIPPCPSSGQYSFGSLRKTFRIADGGVIRGQFHPIYEPDDGITAWLRNCSRDWRDLREAENRMDRNWHISDMSSRSMASMLSVDLDAASAGRQRNQRFLDLHFPVGQPQVVFDSDETPLLQNVLLPDQQTRDSLRNFLMTRGIFCSIHWPVHPLLLQLQDTVDISDALWIEQHALSIPVADEFDEADMAKICDVTDEWLRAGG